MIDPKTLLIEVQQTEAFSWEIVATLLGIALIFSETIIRIYMHNSKMKKELSKPDSSISDLIHFSESEISYLKNLSQTVINNTNKISTQEVEIKNIESIIDELKSLIRDVERDNFTSLSSVSDKIDVLKNILLEAKMNSKK